MCVCVRARMVGSFLVNDLDWEVKLLALAFLESCSTSAIMQQSHEPSAANLLRLFNDLDSGTILQQVSALP